MFVSTKLKSDWPKARNLPSETGLAYVQSHFADIPQARNQKMELNEVVYVAYLL